MLPPSSELNAHWHDIQFGPGTVGIFSTPPTPSTNPLVRVVYDPRQPPVATPSTPYLLNLESRGSEHWQYSAGNTKLPLGDFWVVWEKLSSLQAPISSASYEESRDLHRFVKLVPLLTADAVKQSSNCKRSDGLRIELYDGTSGWNVAAWVVREFADESTPTGGVREVVCAEHWVVNYRWAFELKVAKRIRITAWAGDRKTIMPELVHVVRAGAYYYVGPARPPVALSGNDEGDPART